MNFITDLVKEYGITSIIYEYKKQMEYQDIIYKYTIDGKINWKHISDDQIIDLEFIEMYKENLHFYLLQKQKRFNTNEEFLNKYEHDIDWEYITQEWGISNIELAKKYRDQIEISLFVFAHYDSYGFLFCVDECFTGELLKYIREFKDIMDWERIFDNSFYDIEMPDNFYTEFHNYLTFLDMEHIILI